VKRIAITLVLTLCVVYAADYAMVKYGLPKGRPAFGTVKVERYFSVMKKDGKPDFYFQPPENQTCVRSLFPHFGYEPCWYLERHKEQKTDV